MVGHKPFEHREADFLYEREHDIHRYAISPHTGSSRGIIKTSLSTSLVQEVLSLKGARKFYTSQVERDFDSFVDLFSPNVLHGVNMDAVFDVMMHLDVLSNIIQKHSSLVPDWWFYTPKMLDHISFESAGRVIRESYDASRFSTVVPKVLTELARLEPLDALTYSNIFVLAGNLSCDSYPPYVFGGVHFSHPGEYLSDIRIPLVGVPGRFDECVRVREMRRALLTRSRSCTDLGVLRRSVHNAHLLPQSSLSDVLNTVRDESFDSES